MGAEERICPVCDTRIPEAFPDGFCPTCMLGSSGVRTGSPGAAEAVDSGTDSEATPDATSAPEVSASSTVPASQEVEGFRFPSASELGEQFPDFERWQQLFTRHEGALYRARPRGRPGVTFLEILAPGTSSQREERSRLEEGRTRAESLEHSGLIGIESLDKIDPEGEGRSAWGIRSCPVEGYDLRSAIDERRLDPDRLGRIFLKLASLLTSVADAGLVHRWLCPELVYLDDEGSVFLVGAGLVPLPSGPIRVDSVDATDESLRYEAPESWQDPATRDIRSNLFSLGAILRDWRESGNAPNRSATPQAEELGEAIESLAYRALEREPDRRFRDPEEFRLALHSRVFPQTPPVLSSEPRRRWPWILLALVVLALLAWVGMQLLG